MGHVPVGIFRSVDRPSYDDLVRAQVDGACLAAGGPADDAALQRSARRADTWTVD
jgi:2-oxoglutarate/2-oxoacid ferredoxin oxidoreductase subunit beta